MPTKTEAEAIETVQASLSRPCPNCGGKNWTWGGFVAFPVFSDGTMQLGGSVPAALVACSQCSLLQAFAAKPLGLVEDEGRNG